MILSWGGTGMAPWGCSGNSKPAVVALLSPLCPLPGDCPSQQLGTSTVRGGNLVKAQPWPPVLHRGGGGGCVPGTARG